MVSIYAISHANYLIFAARAGRRIYRAAGRDETRKVIAATFYCRRVIIVLLPVERRQFVHSAR
jgi:hypothetical protein